MSGGFWAGGIPPWAWVEVAGLTILGLLGGLRLGDRLGQRRVRRELVARREERRAARWLAGVRETRGGTVMPPVAHEERPDSQVRTAATEPGWPGSIPSRSLPSPRYAFPAWSLLNADPPTLSEEIRAMIANANAVPSVRWLDRLEQLWAPRASAVPGCPAAHAASTDGSRG